MHPFPCTNGVFTLNTPLPFCINNHHYRQIKNAAMRFFICGGDRLTPHQDSAADTMTRTFVYVRNAETSAVEGILAVHAKWFTEVKHLR
jgi:hypothetical protein